MGHFKIFQIIQFLIKYRFIQFCDEFKNRKSNFNVTWPSYCVIKAVKRLLDYF